MVESIDETITDLLSRAVVDALYVHLETVYSIPKDEVPNRLDSLLTALEKIFGPSSHTITRAIARKFYLKLGLKFSNHPNYTLIEYVNEAKMKLRPSSNLG